MRDKLSTSARTSAALARIRLTHSERLAAEDALEKGELFADLIIGATAAISHAAHGVRRGLRFLAGLRSSS